ncbi:phosphate-starvation-inducible PsiE family protein [Methanovulcanius yangii]|uniref:phosphate-starvation-inducible PsiE family protein n=1 Tax=Methanovulcanius yangii TaxID=1789227 RepID=UPI0029CA6A1D|nr:phosphate-starvation-inducible PsiE family protein [Methanovulcanius yangii]
MAMNGEKTTFQSKMIDTVSSGTMIIYLIIAIILLALAFFSLYDTALGFWIIISGNEAEGMLHSLHAVLLTIIIVEVLETVLVYLRTNIIQVRPILIAGITAMVRRLLFIDTEILTTMLLWELALSILAILVLTIAIYTVSRDTKEK